MHILETSVDISPSVSSWKTETRDILYVLQKLTFWHQGGNVHTVGATHCPTSFYFCNLLLTLTLNPVKRLLLDRFVLFQGIFVALMHFYYGPMHWNSSKIHLYDWESWHFLNICPNSSLCCQSMIMLLEDHFLHNVGNTQQYDITYAYYDSPGHTFSW